ncbi:hypothetical protein GCM10022252_40450 [Streptosporangium oxazolinicum]|uniref:ABC3 transporter permease C-terminal domain-containing protein n=1 Tax=Streptosporangium oxazolinicum TaxID=909287 RepID=A0ABP8B191_9ACTN
MHGLTKLFGSVARGVFPDADGVVEFVDQPSARDCGVSVLERRSEIGLRRALGASRAQIRAQFLTESVVLSALGGAAGTLLGITGTALYSLYNHWPVVVPVDGVAAALGGAVLVGVIAGGYPSIRAARLTPTAALAAV